MTRRRWFERRFEFGFTPDVLPDIIERLRGTPVRLEKRTRRLHRRVLTRRFGESWSIQENVGHLLDLEPLWEGRLDDVLAGEKELRAADLTNRATHEANHNHADLDALLSDFRGTREGIVSRLESLTDNHLMHSARHPRLKEPMAVVDLFFFVAEHDDHHLAQITEILRSG